MKEMRAIEPGYYVDSDGNVFHGKIRYKSGLAGNGYLTVCFGRRNTEYVHRLVCEAFHGPPPAAGYEVRHLNHVKTDNRPDNLAWGSRSRNSKDTRDSGRQWLQKLSWEDVEYIRNYPKSYGYRKYLARKFGVTPNHITDIRARRVWNV